MVREDLLEETTSQTSVRQEIHILFKIGEYQNVVRLFIRRFPRQKNRDNTKKVKPEPRVESTFQEYKESGKSGNLRGMMLKPKT